MKTKIKTSVLYKKLRRKNAKKKIKNVKNVVKPIQGKMVCTNLAISMEINAKIRLFKMVKNLEVALNFSTFHITLNSC